MTEEYRLPDCFTQLPVEDDDEFDRWEHIRGGYRVCIARYYDGDTSFWWVGHIDADVPNVYSDEWTEEANLEAASKSAWMAFRVFSDMDRAFGPARGGE